MISERIAHSLAIHRLETVRVSHWPINWPIYLTCTLAQGQSHCASNIISNSYPFHSKWDKPPIPDLQQFQYFTLKIQGQGHRWGPSLKWQCGSNILSTWLTFYRLTSLSFQVNRPSNSWDMTFSKFDLENPRSRSWKRWKLKSHNMGPTF